jgi:hypothetical protein
MFKRGNNKMAEDISNLVLEQLRAIREGQTDTDDRLDVQAGRLTRIEDMCAGSLRSWPASPGAWRA